MQQKKKQIEEYLESGKFEFLQEMLICVVKAQTKDPVEYCIKWLQEYKAKSTEVHSDDSEEEQDTVEMERLMKQKKAHREKKKSRQGISQEVFGSFNKKVSYLSKVVPKSEESKLLILSLLKQSILFTNVSTADEKILIDAMDQKQCLEGEAIITEGETGDNLYIVSSGKYDCFKTFDGQEKYLRSYKYGQAFGELALLYNAPRAATIRCSEEGVLFTLDRQTFSHVVKGSAYKKRENLRRVLEKVEILSCLSNFEKEQFCDSLKEERFRENEFIIHQGDRGDRFYVVTDGKLVAEKAASPHDDAKIVYHYKEGDYFGELSLMHDSCRKASVKALTPVTLASIDRECFMRMLGPLQEILKRNEMRYE